MTLRALAAILILFAGFPANAPAQERSSDEIVRLAWKASNDGDYKGRLGVDR